MLTNPGFETGLDGWQSSGNAKIRVSNPLPHDGENYVYGENTPLFSVWQDISLSDKGILFSDIDTGNLNVKFGGWQSGWGTQHDNGKISVSLFDSNMSAIGGASLPNFFSNHTWIEQSGVTQILPGTRFIRYEFIGTRVEGSNNDAYLDTAYLNVAAVPIPAALWMFFSGLGFLRFKRHSKIEA